MNIFLVSLGFADILMALLVIPGHAIFCTGCQYTITKHCWFIGGTRFVVFPATKFNLLAITYDRYLAVLRPLQYQVKMTGKRVISILLVAWTLPIVLAVLRNALAAYIVAGEVAIRRSYLQYSVDIRVCCSASGVDGDCEYTYSASDQKTKKSGRQSRKVIKT